MSKSKVFKRTISITMVMLLLIQSVLLSASAIEVEENEATINKIVDGKEVLYEDETKRGDFEKHFLCSDGSYIAATYPEQVNYKDDNGNWVEIDNTLSKTDGRLENKSQELKVSFSQKADDNEMVKLSHNNVDLSWSLSFEGTEAEPDNGIEKLLDSTKGFFTDIFTIEKSDQTDYNELKRNINDVKAVVSDYEETEISAIAVDKVESNLVYEDVFSDTVNASYTVLPGKVKENIILTEKTDLQNYSMHISCEDLFPTITDENCVEFKDVNGEVQYIIQAPYMFDDVYELSYDIQITIEAVDGGYIITFTPDQEWLNSNDRVYPITIDPTVRTNTTKSNFSDTYIFQGSTASSSRALEERLRVGIYNDKKYKALWKATTLPSISHSSAITSATFNLKLPDATTTSRAFSIYKINSTWESDTVTWAQSGEMTYTILQSNVARNTTNDTVTFSGSNLTNAVKSWYSGTANNGFIFRYTDESFTDPDYNVFYSSDNTTSTSYMPYLSITYTNSSQTIANGVYYICNVNSRKYLTAGSTSNGANIYQYQFTDNITQRWEINYAGDGYYTIRSAQLVNYATAYSIDIANASDTNQSNIMLCSIANKDSQLFRIIEGSSGYIISPKISQSKVVEVANGQTGNNANIHLYSYDGSNKQQWTLHRCIQKEVMAQFTFENVKLTDPFVGWTIIPILSVTISTQLRMGYNKDKKIFKIVTRQECSNIPATNATGDYLVPSHSYTKMDDVKLTSYIDGSLAFDAVTYYTATCTVNAIKTSSVTIASKGGITVSSYSSVPPRTFETTLVIT